MISKIVDWVYPLPLNPKRTPEAVLEKKGYTFDSRGNVHARLDGVIDEDEHKRMMQEAQQPNFRAKLEENQKKTQERVKKLFK